MYMMLYVNNTTSLEKEFILLYTYLHAHLLCSKRGVQESVGRDGISQSYGLRRLLAH